MNLLRHVVRPELIYVLELRAPKTWLTYLVYTVIVGFFRTSYLMVFCSSDFADYTSTLYTVQYSNMHPALFLLPVFLLNRLCAWLYTDLWTLSSQKRNFTPWSNLENNALSSLNKLLRNRVVGGGGMKQLPTLLTPTHSLKFNAKTTVNFSPVSSMVYSVGRHRVVALAR